MVYFIPYSKVICTSRIISCHSTANLSHVLALFDRHCSYHRLGKKQQDLGQDGQVSGIPICLSEIMLAA